MSIATQIGRIATAKKQIKEKINQDFNKITNETIDQYAEKLQETYDEYESYVPWEHVEGHNLEFTKGGNGSYLEECNINGHIEQINYNGNNLLDTNNINKSSPSTELTVISNEIGELVINGSSFTGNLRLKSDLSMPLEGDYTLIFKKVSGSISANDINFRYAIGNVSATGAASETGRLLSDKFNGNSDIIVTTGAINDTLDKIDFYFNPNVVFTNFKFVIYLVKGTYTKENVPNYEPFVGGIPSPSPDYPQNIKIVTGKQEITTHSNNLINYNNIKPSFSGLTSVINNDGSVTTSGIPTINYAYIYFQRIIDLLEDGATYTLGQQNPNDYVYVQLIMDPYKGQTEYHLASTKNYSFTVNKSKYKAYSVVIQSKDLANWGTESRTITNKYWLSKGNNITEYIPYQESNYTLNLTSKNLLPYPYVESTKITNGITFTTQSDGSVSVNGTATDLATLRLFGLNNKFPGKYLFGGNNFVKIKAMNVTNSVYTILAEDTGSGAEIDTSIYNKGYIELAVVKGTTINNQIIKPMILNSLDDIEYVPYYNYELCNRGNYKDSIKKSTGKNLFDKNSEDIGHVYSVEGNYNSAIAWNTSDWIKVNNSITISHKTTESTNILLSEFDKSKTFIKRTQTTKLNQTFLLDSNTEYIRISYKNDIGIYDIQIEKGITSTEYEPFGKVWYLKKEIDKVILDGSETYIKSGLSTSTNFIGAIDLINNNIYTPNWNGYSNYFTNYNHPEKLKTNQGFSFYTLTNGVYNHLGLSVDGTAITTIDQFKNWLSTHNTIIYYILATPTYEIITNENLINQLENIKYLSTYKDYTKIKAEASDENLVPSFDFTLFSNLAYQKWLNNPIINEKEEI